MDAREQLQGLQAELNKRGVRDVKFCFAKHAQTPMSHLQEDAALSMKAYLEKKYHPLPDAGDTKTK